VEELTPEDIKDLRRTLKALREQVEANTGQLARFNENIEDFMGLIEQLVPLAEGAAAGNQVLSMVLPFVKGVLKRRRERRADS